MIDFEQDDRGASAPIRLGVVSFLNTVPLIDGLERLRSVEMRFSVPSLLLDALLAREVDCALCSSIDYQRSPAPLVIVPAGILGCHGATLTVRLYARRPIDEVERIYCDTDSHTSVALLQLILRRRLGRVPELVDYDAREHVAENRPIDWPEAMLLIGDKVVTDSPPAVRYPHQLDLGAAWLEETGLPFVFATWMAHAETDPERLAVVAAALDRQRRANRMRLDAIVAHRAVPRRWPRDLAARYLGSCIDYEFDDAHRAGLERFHDWCVEDGLLATRRPLRLFEPVTA